MERSTYIEAIAHLKTGLKLLDAIPVEDRHLRLEFALQTALAPTLANVKGWTAHETRESLRASL